MVRRFTTYLTGVTTDSMNNEYIKKGMPCSVISRQYSLPHNAYESNCYKICRYDTESASISIDIQMLKVRV